MKGPSFLFVLFASLFFSQSMLFLLFLLPFLPFAQSLSLCMQIGQQVGHKPTQGEQLRASIITTPRPWRHLCSSSSPSHQGKELEASLLIDSEDTTVKLAVKEAIEAASSGTCPRTLRRYGL